MALNLAKGQALNLTKTAGPSLNKVTLGLGWDVAKSGWFSSSIDLDASCVTYDENNKNIETIYFGQLKSTDGSIRHTGDNLTGAGDGDDEQIIVNLNDVPKNIKHLVFTINSYRGQTFDKVNNAFCRILNSENNQELAKVDLSAKGQHTGIIVAKLSRINDEWEFKAISEPAQGQAVNQMKSEILNYL